MDIVASVNVSGFDDELRRRIAEERRRTAERIAALERAFEDMVEASADAVRDDEHDPEGQTIAFERAQLASLLQEARTKLTALDAALARSRRPGAGRCARCGRAIGVERLLALPATSLCIDCARNPR